MPPTGGGPDEAGVLWCWHGPGPGRSTKRSQGHSEAMTLVHDQSDASCSSYCLTRYISRNSQRRSILPISFQWTFTFIILLTWLPYWSCGLAEATCTGLSCPTGCQCDEVVSSGGCRVTCTSSTTAAGLATGSISISLASSVTELILRQCSIKTVTFSAFQSFTNLVTLDLTNNDISSLDENVFQTLTNLEVLHLSGNTLQTLPVNIFAGRRGLKELVLSRNSLNQLDSNIFRDLQALEVLSLDDNSFTRLSADVFKGVPASTKIDLSGNSWSCDCQLASLVVWASGRSAGGSLLHPTATQCATPQSAAGSALSQVDATQLDCDPSALFTCFSGDSRAVADAIFLEELFRPVSVSFNQQTCDLHCAKLALPYGVFQSGVVCLCGRAAPSCSCPSNSAKELTVGSAMCSRSYIGGGFSVSLGLLLGPTWPVSSRANAAPTTMAAVALETVWDFGDESEPIRKTMPPGGGSAQHNFPLAGIYNVTLQLPQAGRTLMWPIRVLDPLGSARLVGPDFSDVQKRLDLTLQVDGGTDIDVRWARKDSNDREVLGKRCSFGWHQHNIHHCVRATTLSTTEATNFTAASDKCTAEQASLLTFSSSHEMSSLISLLSSDLATNEFLIDAVKTDNVTYKWMSTGKITHFNVSMVTGGETNDCIALRASGLVGVPCSTVERFICRKVQVYCKYGGKEWHQRTCYVAKGSEQPLSRSAAEESCRSFKSQLARVDGIEKDTFLRRDVLKNLGISMVWLGLTDSWIPNYFIWPNGGSLGSYAPWKAGMPQPSTADSKKCVAMLINETVTTWASVDCSQPLPYLCEYPTGGRLKQVQTYLSGVANFTSIIHTVRNLNPITETMTAMTDLIILPGQWFQHSSRVQTWRFLAQNLPSGSNVKFRLQVYRPVCNSGYHIVPPGCSDLPSPFATCSVSPVSCSLTPPTCSPGYQYCPLVGRCLPLFSPCSCLALDPNSSTGCSGQQYTAQQSQLTSPLLDSASFRFGGAVPQYTLVGETSVELTPGDEGLFNVDAGGIPVQPNDVLGVQFIQGDESVLCETMSDDETSSSGSLNDRRQSVLSLSLPRNPEMELVDVNGAIWLDSIVCNMQAISGHTTSVLPPDNLVDKSVHTVGEYLYSASLFSPLASAPVTLETRVTMQFSVKTLSLAHPQPKWPRRTANAYRTAAVEARTTQTLLWFITKGTDVSVNSTLSGFGSAFSSDCPQSLRSSVAQCSKNYQFVDYSFSVGAPGEVTTVTIQAWNMVSHRSLTVDFLAQEAVKGFQLTPPPVTEFQLGHPITFSSSLQEGSHVTYSVDFGDGSNLESSQGTQSHLYTAPGIYSVSVNVSNYLGYLREQVKLRLFSRARISNLLLTAPDEVDMESDFDVTVELDVQVGSSVATLIDFGDGHSVTVKEPELRTKSSVTIKESYRYALGNTYSLTVLAVDRLDWDGVTDINTLRDEPFVHMVNHSLQAWTVLQGVTVTSSPDCQPIGEAVLFKVNFPSGYNKTGFTFTWSAGDGSANVQTFESDTHRHTYSAPGSYTVTLNIQDNDKKASATYTKCIERPISGLQFYAKSLPLALRKGSSVSAVFHLSVSQGFPLEYLWTYDGKTSTVPPGSFRPQYSRAGDFEVKVKVHNRISFLEARTTVRVIEVVDGLKISHDGFKNNYFKTGQRYDFVASHTAGTNVTVLWTVQAPGVKTVTADRYKIGVTWPSSGAYSVVVVVKNDVSQARVTITANVQVPVTTLSISQVPNVAVGSRVDLQASPNAGTDLVYTWQQCFNEEDCVPITSAAGQSLQTVPPAAGRYTYRVHASNGVSSADASTVVVAWAAMKNLQIEASDVQNDWASTSKDLTFTASLEAGRASTYQWSIVGDKGYRWQGSGQVGVVRLTAEDRYTMTLLASNPIESRSKEVIFNTQHRIQGVTIHPLQGDIAYRGEQLNFTVTYTEGTSPSYKWSLVLPDDSRTAVLSTTDSVSYTFPTVGKYILELEVENRVTDDTFRFPLLIQDPLPGYAIKIHYDSDPYVHQNVSVEISAVGIPADVLASATYYWSIYDSYPPAVGREASLFHNFEQSGNFIVEVRIMPQPTSVFLLVVRKVVHVQGSLPQVTLRPNHSILASGGNVTFEATLNGTVDGLEYHWMVGDDFTLTTNSSVLTHVFIRPQVTRVQVLARNKVSFSGSHVKVIVQDAITDLELLTCCEFNSSEDSSLQASVSRGTNVTYTWTMRSKSNQLNVYRGNQVVYDFPEVGTYYLSIVAENLVDRVERTFILSAATPVRNIRFVDPLDHVYVGQSVTFVVVADGTDVRFQFRMVHLSTGEIESRVEPNGTFAWTFNKPGPFLLSVVVTNLVSQESRYLPIWSSEIRCEPMQLTPIGGNNRVELRSRSLDLEVAVTVNCTRYAIIFAWSLYHNCNKSAPVSLPGAIVNNAQLILPPLELDYGDYCALFTAMYEGTPVVINTELKVRIIASAMKAVIDGGSERQFSADEVIRLDGTQSYDPDLPEGEASGLEYLWTCQSTGRCFEQQTTSQVEIPANLLQAGHKYNVTLRIKKGSREAYTSQMMIIQPEAVPLVHVKCLSCRDSNQYLISSGVPIKLIGSCVNCGGSSVSYSWTVRRDDNELLELNQYSSTTGPNKKNLVINQGFLEKERSYTFNLAVSDPATFPSGITGYSKLRMLPNQPPEGGRCYVSNSNLSVVAMEETLEVACANWTDPDDVTNSPLIYQVYVERRVRVKSSDWYPLYSGSRTSGSYYLSPWKDSEENVLLKVDVIDKLGGRTLGLAAEIVIKVKIPEGMKRFEYLEERMSRMLPVLVLHQSPKEMLQFCIALTNQLNIGEENPSVSDTERRRSMRANMLQAINDTVFSQTLGEMQQLAYLLKQLTAVETEFPRSIDSYNNVLYLVRNMVTWMKAHVSTAVNGEEFVPDNVMAISTNVINSLNKWLLETMMIESSSAETSSPGASNSSLEAMAITVTTLAPPTLMWRKLVEKAVALTDTIQYTYAQTKIPGEDPFAFDLDQLFVIGQNVYAESIQREFNINGCVVRLPEGLLDHLAPGQTVFQSVSVLTSNPFPWGYVQQPVTSQVLGILFKRENGTEILVHDLDDKHLIELTMPVVETSSSAPPPSMYNDGNDTSLFAPGASFKAAINSSLFNHGGLNIEVLGNLVPFSNETETAELDKRLWFTAYLGYGWEPFWLRYDKKLEIRSNSSSHRDYTFFTMINSSVVDLIYITVTNNDDRYYANITLRPYEVQCQFYDPSSSVWSKSGCQPTSASNKSHTTCLCNHLTMFGASSVVSPASIDFSDLTRLDLHENPVVVILVSVVAGIFIVFVFWARQYDLQDLHNISIVPLCGRDGLYKYEVVVVTSRKRGAGTSSNVGIKLYGEEGKSGARHLARLGAFQRNSEDTFLVATDEPLGTIQKIHLWHDNTGKHPSWCVVRVVVRDLQTNRKFFFLVNGWLSLTVEEKGTLDKQVYAAGPEELSNFGTVFHSETNRGFSERHVWLSVWDRPPRSRFTRVQRVVCCTTLIYSFMCANVMWYGLLQSPTPEVQALGLVSLSWQDFVVGILASIVVFPINFVIIQIFRFSKVKVNAYDYGIKPGTAQTIEVEAMCDISQAGDSFIVYNERKSFTQRLHREASSDSIMVPTRPRRSAAKDPPPKIVTTTEEPHCSHSDVSNMSTQRQDQLKQVPIEGKKWWSYDTILKWPENLPSDNHVTDIAKSGPLKKRSALRSINTLKESDSEELVIDDDIFTSGRGRLRADSIGTRKNHHRKQSVSESIPEVSEDAVESISVKPDCSKKYESLPTPPASRGNVDTVDPPAPPPTMRERADSWGTIHSVLTLKADATKDAGNGDDAAASSSLSSDAHLLSPAKFNPRGEPCLDSDSGEVNRALLEIDTNIHESQLIEPRLLNKKKLSGNQGNTPHVDILRLDELDSKDVLDLDTTDLEPQPALRKTRSKTRVTKRWAQIVIPPEYEKYQNEHFCIFDPDDEFDAVPIETRNALKSRDSSLSTATTASSRFHQLMPSTATTTPTRYLLPHSCIYVAYALCFIVSGFSVIITIIYGHRFGRDLALKWLLAFFISIIDSVFILEPLKVLALAVFVAMLTRGIQDEDEGIETRPMIESNEKFKDVRMKPIGGFALLQAREEGLKIQRMHRLLRHCVVYLLFVWVAFFLTYRAHNTQLFPVTMDIRRSLAVGTTANGSSLNTLQRPEEVLPWLSEVAIPALYPDENMTTNTQRLLLGEMRLRQIRSIPVDCHVSGALIKLSAAHLVSRGCHGNPGWTEDTRHFEENWIPNASNATWLYSTADQAMGGEFTGDVDTFGGGGYIQSLGPKRTEAVSKIASLEQGTWIDRGTRAVFLEGNLYTIHSQLHSTVRILAEFPLSGGVWMKEEIQTFQLQNHVPGRVSAIMIFIAFLSLIWIYLVIVVLFGLRRHGYAYFFAFWHWVEFIIMVLVFGVVIVFAHRAVVDTAAYDRYKATTKDFTSFYDSAYFFGVWKAMTGILVFILTAWMVRLMRFLKPLATYGRTIRSASAGLLGCAFFLTLLVVVFSQMGHLWFGSLVGSFRSVSAGFSAMFGLIRGRSMYMLLAMQEVNPHSACFFLFCFVFSIMVGAMALFRAVLNSTYKTVRLQTYYHSSLDMQDYDMIEFMMKRFKKYIGITKPKPAFRRVKFQGMPSISTRSSLSSRAGMTHSLVSSGSNDPFGLDALEEQTYLEELLDRCVPTWERMLETLERVLWLDREITRLETAIIESLGGVMFKRLMPRMKHFQGLTKAARAVGKVVGARGSRCHRSHSESLMTDVRAKQIRDALNAELLEMEEKIIADVEKSKQQQQKATIAPVDSSGRAQGRPSLTSVGVSGRRIDFETIGPGRRPDMEMNTLSGPEVIKVAESKPPSGRNPAAAASTTTVPAHKPPVGQPKRFLSSAGPRRTFNEVGSASAAPPATSAQRESPSSVRRRGSAQRPRTGSPIGPRPGTAEVRDAPAEAQRAYCSKLPRRDIKIPAVSRPNFTRRPTSEQSERVKKNPDLPLPKQESS